MVEWAVQNAMDMGGGAGRPLGMGGALAEEGIPRLGPDRARGPARLFSSLMSKKNQHHPRAPFHPTPRHIRAQIRGGKADGRLGKGVLTARRGGGHAAVKRRTAPSAPPAAHVVVEEFLTGPEVSVLSFTDGQTVVPMVSVWISTRSGRR